MLTEASLASAVVRRAAAEGAQVMLTSPECRGLRLTQRVALRLGVDLPVLPLDVTEASELAGLADGVRAAGWDQVDGVLHAIAYAPPAAVGAGVAGVGWPDVAVALQTSTWSLAGLVDALLPLLPSGASVVGLTFDASRAFPSYDWMGVAKAGLESLARYLARDLGPRGVRVNLVSAGPLRTMAARSVPGFDRAADGWGERAPLGWDARDGDPVARACVALLSDWFPATTGEVLHVDGGAHAVA